MGSRMGSHHTTFYLFRGRHHQSVKYPLPVSFYLKETNVLPLFPLTKGGEDFPPSFVETTDLCFTFLGPKR